MKHGLTAVMRHGGARRGDCTMLDVWLPVHAIVSQHAKTAPLPQLAVLAAETARTGLEEVGASSPLRFFFACRFG